MESAWVVWWKERSANERYGLLGGVAVVLVVAIAGLYWALKPGYEVLFSGLDPRDVASISNQLAAEGLHHEVDTKAGKIMVAKDDVYAARIKVMERGLALAAPVGFELFDEADFGMTDFTQQINYRRALEGELARTIMALDEIEHARLHLVLPETGLFTKPKEPPKASLTVVVKDGATLTPARVQGIQRLIAAAVPELEARNVTVHDQRGVALTRPAEAGTVADAAGERLEAKQINEAYLTRKAQEVLDRAFGPGAAAVIVDVALDLNKRQTTREETLPVEGGVTGAVIRQRTSSATRNNLGAQTTAATLGATAQWPPLNTEVEYAVGRNVEQVDMPPGAIRRLTVGVLVPRGLDLQSRTRMSELVASAVGLDATRGDTISLQELPTLATEPEAPGAAPIIARAAAEARTVPVARVLQVAAAATLAVVLLLILAVRIAIARGRAQGIRPLTVQQRERLLADLQEWLNSGRGAGTGQPS